jgi:hypothetical protein
MKYEISTSEAAEVFDVTGKTICEWSKSGIMVKLAHGKYDLKESLQNWVAYQKCIFEGADNPLELWMNRRDIAWSEAHPIDYTNAELVPLENLRTFEVEIDAAGRITRVVDEAKG